MDQPAPRAPASSPSILDRVFDLGNSGSNLRTELLAGLTTFLTMVYIVFVNPQILGNAGMDKGAVFVATCIAAAVSTAVMALYANYPIALAPGMGLNAFFAFTVVLAMKYTWQQALAAVFCSGVIFFLISILRIREYIINSIPRNLKLAISAGIGLFLGIIALEEAKIVVASPATLLDPARFSCCRRLFPGPAERGAVNPDAVEDHGQPTRQSDDRLFHPTAPGDLHRPGLEPRPFLRTQHALRCLVEHDPHHLISAARCSAAALDLTGLVLGARQPKHGTDGLGFAEASRHVDGGAIGQRHHRADTGGRHQAPAHFIIPHDG